MSLITIEVHDEQFRQYLTEVQLAVHNMWNTLQEVSKIVELQTRKFVPVDTTRLERGYFERREPSKFGQEMIVGFQAIDPRDGYNYALYTHEGIDYRTGRPIRWHKPSARDHYLWWGMFSAERTGAFELIEGDYLSLWRNGG